jgi:hypothetical protein
MRAAVPLLLATGLGLAPVRAQEGMKPAPVIHIDIELIKEGKTAVHEKVEAEWLVTLRKAGFPANYYAFASMSGINQVWWIQPMPSFAANEEYEKFTAKEPLRNSLDNLDSRDGELRASSRRMWAVLRPDLSYKPESCNLAKTRFVDLATYRIKLGKDEDFVNGAKAIFDAYRKSNIEMCLLGYEVTAGEPTGTFLLAILMDSMKFMDAEPERLKAMKAGMPESTYQQLMKGTGDLFVSMEHNLFELKPGMSLPSQAVIDADPAFWRPKTAAKPERTSVGIPGPAEQKKQ